MNSDGIVECLICCRVTVPCKLNHAGKTVNCEGAYCQTCAVRWLEENMAKCKPFCAQLKCPACLRLLKSTELSKLLPEKEVVEYEERAISLLTIRCPGCHSNTSFFRQYNERVNSPNTVQFRKLLQKCSEYHVKQLQEACQLFIQGKISTPKYFEQLEEIFQENIERATDLMISLIPDVERRTAFHLYFLRKYPNVETNCCRTPVCFVCQVAGKHTPQDCDRIMCSFKEHQMVKCPSCAVLIVRSEGCDSMTCVCGTEFCFNCGEPLDQHNC